MRMSTRIGVVLGFILACVWFIAPAAFAEDSEVIAEESKAFCHQMVSEEMRTIRGLVRDSYTRGLITRETFVAQMQCVGQQEGCEHQLCNSPGIMCIPCIVASGVAE